MIFSREPRLPKRRARPRLLAFPVLIALALAGCIERPALPLVAGETVSVDCEATCSDLGTLAWPAATTPARSGLDPAGFQVVSWNLQKGRQPGWQADLERMASRADLLLLQEGYLDDDLRAFLDGNAFQWGLATAFAYRQIDAGVLTAAKFAPNSACAFRRAEPLIRLPKTAFISRYPIAGSNRMLMVANVHGINFTLGLQAFRDQFAHLVDLVEEHRGPLIIAGDFNTWSVRRQAVVRQAIARLGLRPLAFTEDHRTTVFGHPLDHLYYRGLTPTRARAIAVDSSDHNPLLVTFSLPATADADPFLPPLPLRAGQATEGGSASHNL